MKRLLGLEVREAISILKTMGEESECLELPRPRSRMKAVFAPGRRVVRIYRRGDTVVLESAEFPQPAPGVPSHPDDPGGEELADDSESP